MPTNLITSTRRSPSGTSVDRDDPWQTRAACAGEDVTAGVDPFHLRDGERLTDETWDLARSICDRCPVLDQCLTETVALDRQYGPFGFRAGVAPEDRERRPRQAAP